MAAAASETEIKDPFADEIRNFFDKLKKCYAHDYEGDFNPSNFLKSCDAATQNALKDAEDIKSASKNRPVHYAALYNDAELLDTLFNYQADMTRKNKLGSSVLHLACCAGSADVVETLVEYLKSPDDQNKLGNSYLHCAVLSGSLDCVIALVGALRKKFPDEFELRPALKKRNFASYTPGMYASYYEDVTDWFRENVE